MGIGVGKVNEFKLQITVREQKVESPTTEGLTRKSGPAETTGKPDLPPPPAGNSLRETLVIFYFNF